MELIRRGDHNDHKPHSFLSKVKKSLTSALRETQIKTKEEEEEQKQDEKEAKARRKREREKVQEGRTREGEN